MKKLLIGVLALLPFFGTGQMQTVQPFLDLGIKLLAGPSMYNSNVFTGNEDIYDHKLSSFGFGGGAKIAIDINDYIAIVGEGLWMQNKQVYKLSDPSISEKTIQSQVIEIPAMLRYNSSSGYTEGGYVFSKVLGVKESYQGVMTDYSDLYSKSRHGLVFGFGGYLAGNENFAVSAGLRFRYDLTDIVSPDVVRYANAPTYAEDIAVTSKTNPISIMFNLELNYDLGFVMARNPCTGRRKMLFTN